MLFLLLGLLLAPVPGGAQELLLAPGDPAELGEWAQVAQPLRLYPTLPALPAYEGPPLATKLFGEILLGQARYPLLLGISPQNEPGLWLDLNRDGRLSPEEKLQGIQISGGYLWSAVLSAEPKGSPPYAYPLEILWPAGRGYVFVVGGAPQVGRFGEHTVVLVDGDLDGVFGTKGDFLGVDVDRDGRIHAEPDGHERFALTEAFTVGTESFRVVEVSPDGRRVRLERTAYTPPKPPLLPGSPAPDFSFRDFSTGEKVSLSSLTGKVVLLDFWATWCPPCMASLPDLRALYEEFREKGFEIVGVSLDESEADLRRVMQAHGISWPVAFEGKRWENSVAGLYRVYQIPTTYLLDRDGVIRQRDLDGVALRQALGELLAEPGTVAPPADRSLPPRPREPQPILEIHAPKEVNVQVGKNSAFSFRLRNVSPYHAEGLAVSVRGLPPGMDVQVSRPQVIPARGEGKAEVQLFWESPAPQGFPAVVEIAVTYEYCIEEDCFSMVQDAQTVLVLGASPEGGDIPWWVWVLLGAGVLLAWFILGPSLGVLPGVLLVLALGSLIPAPSLGLGEVHAALLGAPGEGGARPSLPQEPPPLGGCPFDSGPQGPRVDLLRG